jgi:hypothetical protein
MEQLEQHTRPNPDNRDQQQAAGATVCFFSGRLALVAPCCSSARRRCPYRLSHTGSNSVPTLSPHQNAGSPGRGDDLIEKTAAATAQPALVKPAPALVKSGATLGPAKCP